MRLLHATSLYMKEFHGNNIPAYIILSHRWEDVDEEVKLKDFELGTAQRKRGYGKVQNLCRIAQQYHVKWVWLDTCCIDKANSTELNEAINSMYKWYANSEFCVAYLFDYDSHKPDSIGVSSWFTRCWTLQELISPQEVRFYDCSWCFCGTKAQICKELAEITGIDTATLKGADPRRCSIAQRMSWAADRQATRIEDEAYSLLGLFDLSLPMLYGDGEKAFMTLQERIMQYSDDPTILAWDSEFNDDPTACHGLLAKSPSAFRGCNNTRIVDEGQRICTFTYNFTGMDLKTRAVPEGMNTYVCVLDCTSSNGTGCRDAILLERFEDGAQFARVRHGTTTIITVLKKDIANWPFEDRTFSVRQTPNGEREGMIHGFHLQFLGLPDVRASQMRRIRCFRGDGTVVEPNAGTGTMVVDLSQDLWGTVALVSLPESDKLDHRFDHTVPRRMRLGFDTDFNPMIEVSADNLGLRHSQHWASSWLQPGENPDTIPNEKFFHRWERSSTYSQRFLRSESSHLCYIPVMKLNIRIDRKEIVSDRAAERLARCGSGPWDIWQVTVEARGSFVEDEREERRSRLAERKRRKDANNNKIAWSVIGGTLLLGGVIRYLER